MRRMIVVLALVIGAMSFTTVVFAEDAPPPPTQPPTQPTVVKLVVKRPPKLVHRRAHLHLPVRPSTAEVIHAINREAVMWGVPAASLSRRVACESRYHWWATNGQYVGVLQMGANAFYRGLSTIRTRKVTEVAVRTRRMHSRVYRHWSSGRVTRSRGRVVRQRVVLTKRTMLPRHPTMSNVDTQLRIGAQALRGISGVRSSEWACAA